MEIKLKIEKTYNAKYLDVSANVRYWEDSIVNDAHDEEGDLMPCRKGDSWCPFIDIEAGKILNWDQGKTASVHYKVADEGVYQLLDENKNLIVEIDGYVPETMSPKENGYGDYIIMDIDENGMIQDWKFNVEDFEQE